MIPTTYGGKPIAGYLPAPLGDEIYCLVRPKEGETFIGIEAGYYAEGSPACIEIRKGNTLLQTVNCAYVIHVWFVAPPEWDR